MKRHTVAVALLIGLFALVAAAADRNCELKFLVIRDYNGKPIRNASVVLHQINSEGRQAKGGLQLKTDAEGRTFFGGVPFGKLRVQVLAPGFQTFGEDYDINQPAMEITIKIKRPTDQYSIYDDKNQTLKKDAAPPNSTNKDEKAQDPKPH